MASRALAGSLHSSSRHVIAYLPSLSAAVTYFRSFCSENNSSGSTIRNVRISVESVSDRGEGLPETTWGPLSAAATGFPLPGQTGLGSLESDVTDESVQTPILYLGRPKTSDIFTIQLPFDRHVDVFHQLKHQVPTLLKERTKELKQNHVVALERRLISGTSNDVDVEGQNQNSEISINDTNDFLLECRFFDCPTLLKKDFNSLFPQMDFTHNTFTVITLCQKTVNDMTGWNEDVDAEREDLLHSFFDAAQSMAETLKGAGFWADFIDPSSGKPFLSAYTNATMFETDDRFRHLGFEIEDLGCCKVIRHHKWGTHAYVGCVFTSAPMNHTIIQEITSNL